MKRILFITTNDGASWGGSEILWFETVKQCLINGIRVGVCINQWNQLPLNIEKLRKSNNVDFFFRPSFNSTARRVINKLKSYVSSNTDNEPYQKSIINWKPHLVVVSQGGNSDGVGIMQFLIKSDLPYLTISQAAYEGWWPDSKLSERMSFAFSEALHNYFVSYSNLKLTELQIGKQLYNVSVIRNPFNVPYVNNLKYPKTDTFQIACVARYDFQSKGQDILLEVMNQQKWKERNLIINLYGSGKHEYGIKKIITEFNLNNIYIKGHQKPLSIWEENHALILPSRYEGLPLSLVEAMLCSRFGIVTDVSGNREVILDSVNGFLAAAPKCEYLDLAMERAWERRNEWEEIGISANNYIKQLVPENPALDFFVNVVSFL